MHGSVNKIRLLDIDNIRNLKIKEKIGFSLSYCGLRKSLRMFQSGLKLFQINSRALVRVKSEIPNRTVHRVPCMFSPRRPPKSEAPSPAFASKYRILDDSNAQVIKNTEEENPEDYHSLFADDEFDGINLERGKTGVFDIDDLVSLLQRENSKDIFVASVPLCFNYVEYICIVSGRSRRHMIALAEFVRKVYKRKCSKSDILPRIEGKDSNDWVAIDLGNIALHILSEKSREIYDLETLWSVGPEYDDELNKQEDNITDILQNYSTYLKDLKPLS